MIEGGEALDVEPGEPHRADDGDPERVAVLLEGTLHVDPLAVGGLETLLDQPAVRLNVETPVAELGNLALLFAHHDGDLRFPSSRRVGLPEPSALRRRPRRKPRLRFA